GLERCLIEPERVDLPVHSIDGDQVGPTNEFVENRTAFRRTHIGEHALLASSRLHTEHNRVPGIERWIQGVELDDLRPEAREERTDSVTCDNIGQVQNLHALEPKPVLVIWR